MGKKRLPEHSGLVIILLILVRIWSALSNLIYDCDETYNYWDVSHYLIYGNGFVTWEYSPQYALRSYLYLWIYSLPSFILSFIVSNELILFYMTRIIIACFSVFCELYFCIGLHRCAGSSVSRYCLIFLLMSSGTYLASTSFLPNTLSMHLTMIMFGAWFCRHYKMTIFSAGISILIGWPYAGLAYVPIALQMLLSRWRKFLYFVMFTLVYGLMISFPLILVDSYYYGRFVITPLNAVLYNVFNPDAGPELYGTEPATYYIVNLILNFNILVILSLLSLPMLILSKMFMTKRKHKMQESGHWLCVFSLMLWLAVFSRQSHKEERFLYPIYPLVCATAALTTKLIETFVSGIRKPHTSPVFKSVVITWCAIFVSLSMSRVASLNSGFRSTLDIFSDLKHIDSQAQFNPIVNKTSEETVDHYINICFGKEWYRYPNSFFLPDSRRYRPRFIKSDFEGQLPKLFEPGTNGAKPKTWEIYNDFNNMNQEEKTRYVKLEKCHYLIDSGNNDINETTKLQPDYSKDIDTWNILSTHKLLDLNKSPAILRSFYLPKVSHQQNKYKNYYLLQNKKLFRLNDK